MFSLFSLSTSLSDSSGPRAIDLQLLSDEEVLKVWYQSQMIMNMLEEKEIPSSMTAYYTQMVEQELQNRSQLQPSVFFKSACEQEMNDTGNIVSQQDSSSFTSTILATNILI